jgi:hypothetical protein
MIITVPLLVVLILRLCLVVKFNDSSNPIPQDPSRYIHQIGTTNMMPLIFEVVR